MQGTAHSSRKFSRRTESRDHVIRIQPRSEGERICASSTKRRVTINKLGGPPCTVCFDLWTFKMKEGRTSARLVQSNETGRYQIAHSGPGVGVKRNRHRR